MALELCNFSETWASLLLRVLSYCRVTQAFRFSITQLWDYSGYGGKTSYRLAEYWLQGKDHVMEVVQCTSCPMNNCFVAYYLMVIFSLYIHLISIHTIQIYFIVDCYLSLTCTNKYLNILGIKLNGCHFSNTTVKCISWLIMSICWFKLDLFIKLPLEN